MSIFSTQLNPNSFQSKLGKLCFIFLFPGDIENQNEVYDKVVFLVSKKYKKYELLYTRADKV